MRDTTRSIPAPDPPAAASPYSFPLLATVAPVVVSVAIWLITQSVFALVFAALGPAVAVASVADARLQARRRGRREAARFEAELAEARVEIAAAHGRERDELVASSPSAARLVDGGWSESEHWLASLAGGVAVSLGRADRPSGVTLDAVATRGRTADHDRLRALVAEAAVLSDAPALVDARLGIGVAGPDPLATAVARGIVVQLAASLSPLTHSVTLETADGSAARTEWLWLDDLPHDLVLVDGRTTVVRVQSREVAAGEVAAGVGVAVAPRRESLPRLARVVVATGEGGARIVQHPDRAELAPLRLEPVSREQALGIARAMTEHARRARLVGGAAALPAGPAFDDCGGRDDGGEPPGLDCAVALTAAGPLRLDLAAHGPHAVVGGTTGSGKSELLVAWVLAMARAHPPRAASVLLVDFKGGSAFAALAALPHCVGVITDLDETGAARALESLAAELRRRERVLAGARAKSVEALASAAEGSTDLPRLVIVVDEFAAMVAGYPELHALFGDIAARGRSLGVHLVLCTQRPAGVIRDAVLANSALRVSLRVNNRGDSVAVIGSDEAAALPLTPRGRAWVAADGDAPVLAQFPLVTPDDIDGVARRWSSDPYRPHRPWLDPLPSVVSVRGLEPGEPGSFPVGRLDDPAEQSQPTALYRPATHGNLLVVGGAGSGKTGVLEVLESADPPPLRVARVPTDVEGAWDFLTATLAAIRGGRALPATLVLLDDLDTLVARFPEEYEGAVLELVSHGLREGPGRGIHWALTAQRLTSGLHSIAALCGSRLLLRLPTRQEHVLAGGDGEHHSAALPPGAGRWQGLRVQVARAEAPRGTGPHRGPPPELDLSRPLAVVSRRPAQFADRLRHGYPDLAGPGAVVLLGAAGITVSTGTSAGPAAIVGDAQAWLSNWGSIATLRPTHTVVVDGCGAGEFRSITRVAELPPPLAATGADGTPAAFWTLDPEGRIARARLRGEGDG